MTTAAQNYEALIQECTLPTRLSAALKECDPELRVNALELIADINSGELDEYQKHATAALLAEILYPNADDRGAPGLDLEEAEALARKHFPATAPLLDQMDEQEATFAVRLRALMEAKGLTQVALAAKVGLGQPAISMMLNRTCRPQRKTVQKLADALGVAPTELWPDFKP